MERASIRGAFRLLNASPSGSMQGRQGTTTASRCSWTLSVPTSRKMSGAS